MAETDDRVELTDLDVITRYSLAVRAATADRDELIETLRGDLAWLEGGRRRATPAPAAPRATPARSATSRTAPRKTTPVKKTPAAKKTVAKKTVAKKTVAKKTARRR